MGHFCRDKDKGERERIPKFSYGLWGYIKKINGREKFWVCWWIFILTCLNQKIILSAVYPVLWNCLNKTSMRFSQNIGLILYCSLGIFVLFVYHIYRFSCKFLLICTSFSDDTTAQSPFLWNRLNKTSMPFSQTSTENLCYIFFLFVYRSCKIFST